MFCQNCGAESAPGLKYCKRCGSAISVEAGKHEPVLHSGRFSNGLWPLATFGIASIGLLVGGAIALYAMGISRGALIMILALGCGTIMSIASTLVKQMSRLADLPQRPEKQINDKTPPQLQTRPQSIGSVTEHTTRGFEREDLRMKADWERREG